MSDALNFTQPLPAHSFTSSDGLPPLTLCALIGWPQRWLDLPEYCLELSTLIGTNGILIKAGETID